MSTDNQNTGALRSSLALRFVSPSRALALNMQVPSYKDWTMKNKEQQEQQQQEQQEQIDT